MLGEGILKGLAETARNQSGELRQQRSTATVQFPEERARRASRTPRNFPFTFVYMTAPTGSKRPALRLLLHLRKECPPKCIFIEEDLTQKPS